MNADIIDKAVALLIENLRYREAMYKGRGSPEETLDRIETLFRIRAGETPREAGYTLNAVLRVAVRQVDNPSGYEREFFSPWTVEELEALCELKRRIEP